MKILIVEDEEGIRLWMEKVLTDGGYQVKCAEDGEQGLKLFNNFQPEIVLSDINMPNMNGLEMLEEIRKIDPNSLFIIITALNESQLILQALRLKANDYLVKPLSGKDLLILVQKYSDILENRTPDREVLGMIYTRTLGMKVTNRLDLVSKIIDRLMQETEHVISPGDRLGIHLGLAEIIINAIEHGNMGITYKEKSKAVDGTIYEWNELLKERCESPEYGNRLVDIKFQMTKNRCEWLITDQGEGFNWKLLPDPNSLESLNESHGRGIMLANLSFSEITYLGKGNQVRLVKHLTAHKS